MQILKVQIKVDIAQWLTQNALEPKNLRFLLYSATPNPVPVALSDSSFIQGIKRGNTLIKHDFKDHYGWVVMWHGGPIAWSSRKHNHVGKSTAQVEYMAMSHCHDYVISLRQLLAELKVMIGDDSPTPLYGDSEFIPTPIFGDNKAAIRRTLCHRVISIFT